MAQSTPTKRLLNQRELCDALNKGKWTIDDRIQRYPKDHPNAFPVEYIGRHRRFDLGKVRAWFAWEAEDFNPASTPAA